MIPFLAQRSDNVPQGKQTFVDMRCLYKPLCLRSGFRLLLAPAQIDAVQLRGSMLSLSCECLLNGHYDDSMAARTVLIAVCTRRGAL
jgi:hypothetical protein